MPFDNITDTKPTPPKFRYELPLPLDTARLPRDPPPKPKKLRLPDERPLEKEVERKVCEYAKAKGYYVRKFVSPAHRSVPDRYFIAPGRPGATFNELAASLADRLFYIEFKRPGEKATESQKREHDVMRGYGVIVYVVDSVEEGNRIVDRHLAWWMK